MRRVTTHDIAREAGVSRTTVSHVLNNHPGIILSPKTRQRVLATARKLGYVPNSAAQMLVTGRSRTIGLILSRPDLISVDAFVPMLIGGLNEACRTRRYRLLMETIEDPADVDAYLDLAKSKRIDGLIVINPRKGDIALRKVIESKFPVVELPLCISRHVNGSRGIAPPLRRQSFRRTKSFLPREISPMRAATAR
jgi:DNA-binding LacI/PurR family transcriptional regulator